MTTTVNLRPVLDLKAWEVLAPTPSALSAGVSMTASRRVRTGLAASPDTRETAPPLAFLHGGTSSHWLYNVEQDAYMAITGGTVAGNNTAGTAVAFHPSGPTGTASAGSSTTITTATTVQTDLAGRVVRITGGTGAGQERIISRNTVGSNSVLTVTSAWGTNPDATSTYLILSGRFYVFSAGATPGLRYYDIATAAWSSALVVTGVTFAGTDASLVATPGSVGAMAAGTATAGGSTTLTNGSASWATNQWTNFQVRIVSGTGAGQVRSIASNTGTVLTVSSAWGTNPDATSVYRIEGNDDYLYLIGNGVVTLWRYSISGNSWSTLSPGAARSAAPGAGQTLDWIFGSTHGNFNTEATIVNGRRLYSFRGGSTGTLDYYDIAANTWTSAVTLPWTETIGTGGGGDYDGGEWIYLRLQASNANPRLFRYAPATNKLEAWSQLFITDGSTLNVGQRIWTANYVDGATTIAFVYIGANSSTAQPLYRAMVI